MEKGVMTLRSIGRWVWSLKRFMYRGGRADAVMRLANRLDVMLYRTGLLSPRRAAVLKVAGRNSGKLTSVPVAVAKHRGADYLVSMLGPDANWVRNVRAAGGRAVLGRRGREIPIMLVQVPPEHRAEILRGYLAIAPGARPHLGLTPTAPLSEFRKIAPNHPVFRILRRGAELLS
ncbi:nitroreductase family deazaflavin-dependent oxidoreductase [Nonomuraea sp. NPDC050451]|uniref:nitroreductase family deazaflavin-dependent oxidoreductase n=1 Tax=Nonomuraea sp. NPDC050451 TaxID=3364364 RepID=UPI00378C8045